MKNSCIAILAACFAVKGHEYGLDLSAEDKKALIEFLNTL